MAIRNLKATWVFLFQVGAFLKLLRDFQMSGCIWGVGAMGLDLKGLLEQIDFTPLHVSTDKCSRYGCLIQKERSHDLYTGKIDTWRSWRIMPGGKTYKFIHCHSKGYEAQKNLWLSWFNSLGSQCIFPPPLMISKLSVPPLPESCCSSEDLRSEAHQKRQMFSPETQFNKRIFGYKYMCGYILWVWIYDLFQRLVEYGLLSWGQRGQAWQQIGEGLAARTRKCQWLCKGNVPDFGIFDA